VELARRSQKSWSAARPLANVSATRDGDIAPGLAQHRAHRIRPPHPTFGRKIQKYLWWEVT
jgi:hypothetical protein